MRSLTLNIHDICNARCKFCVVGLENTKRQKQRFTSYSEIITALEQGKGHFSQLVISGGEPTIYPELRSVVKQAKALGYSSIEMKTNGIALEDPGYVNELAECGIDTFCIAVHGHNPGIHDELVGYPGAFEAIIAAGRNIRQAGKTVITPICVTKKNYRYLDKIVQERSGK